MEFWALVLLVLAVLLLQCAEGTPHRHHPPHPHPRPPHGPTPPRSPPPRPSPPSPTPTPPRPTPTPPPPPPSSQNCTQLSQLSEGPYWLEENIEASNVKLNLSYGVPLNITFKIVNGTLSAERAECAAIEDARIDIWQCRYDGLYSDEVEESTLGETWLRGYQYTNSTGHLSFQTIYPGWYTSRTVHIHLRVRIYQVGASTASYEDTTQLFFDDTISEAIFANVYPYNSRGFARRDTYNAGDPLFRSANLITLTGSYSDPDGFSSLVELSLPFSNSRALSDGDDENNHVQSRFYSIL